VDWRRILRDVVVPMKIDTFVINDSCFAASAVPQPEVLPPDDVISTSNLWVISAASAFTPAGSGRAAFTKAVIYTLAPAPGQRPISFTPFSLFRALPELGVEYATVQGQTYDAQAIISGSYVPKFFVLYSAGPRTIQQLPPFRIGDITPNPC
jgi:hypothetical protein